MRLKILGVGRLRDGPERALTNAYIARAQPLGRTLGFRSVEETEIASGGGAEAEGARLLARLPAGGRAFRLDEAGDQLSSDVFAARLAAARDAGTPEMVFLIGGADGFSGAVRRAAPSALAFGVQTWPHRLVRAMLAEQIYRALTILAGTPYHKD